MAKTKKTTPRRRRSVPLPPRQGRPGAMSPTLWADAYREAEAGGQLRLLETEPMLAGRRDARAPRPETHKRPGV